MTPNELMQKYILSRIIGWRYQLEELDAAAVAEIIKVLKSANSMLRQKIEDELPQVWDNYTPDKGGAAIRFWLGDLLDNSANQINSTITEAWSISAQKSLEVYNDVLSFGGLATGIATLPVTLETIKGLASRKLFAGQSLAELIGKAFSEGQIASIIQSLDKSRANGWGYQKAVKDVLKTAIDEGFTVTQRQAITLARSYIQQASVNSQLAVYEHNKDVVKGVKWCGILDNRICELCAASDGLQYTWDEERPPMPRHPRCLLPYTLVSARDAIAGFVAEYDGPVYDFELYNGTEFSITENHPILTERGFLPACEIDKDIRIFCNNYERGLSNKSIKEIVGEMRCYDHWGNKIHDFEEIKVSKYGFHGDGQYCTKAGFIDFIPSSWDKDNLYFYRNPLNDLFLRLECDKRIMSASEAWSNQYGVLQKWYEKYENRGFALFKYKSKIKRYYKGPVFDLQTLSSMYYADGAIVSNCRCLWLPWVKTWRDLGIDADDLEKAARPWLIREEGNIDAGGTRKVKNFGTSKEDFAGWWATLDFKQQSRVIGPVRTRLINEGKLSWKDLMNKNTGHFYTLEELGYNEAGKPLL